MATEVIQCPLDKLIEHYSDWAKLKNAVAWLQKFFYMVRGLTQPSNSLLPDDLRRAEKTIILHVQSTAFPGEIRRLSLGSSISNHSPVHSLDPQLDGQGILVVGGRLRHSNLRPSEKHPIILPYKSKLSLLIARAVHNRCHLGRE